MNNNKYKRFADYLEEIATALGTSCNDKRKAHYYEECSYFNLDLFEKCYKPLKNGEISLRFPSIAQIKSVYHEHLREVVNAEKSRQYQKEADEMSKLSPFGTRWGLRILTCHASDLVKWSHENAYQLCQFACMLSSQIDKGMIDEAEALETLIEESKTYSTQIDKAWIQHKTRTALKNKEPVLGDYLAV